MWLQKTNWVRIVTAWAQSWTTTLCHSDLLPYIALMPSKCHPTVAEEAQLSTMRRGRAQPCHQRRARPLVTLRSKRIAKLKFRYPFAESDLNTLKLCLKGPGRPWETIPLNNSPFLMALVVARSPNVCFTECSARFSWECGVLPAPHQSSHSAADVTFRSWHGS